MGMLLGSVGLGIEVVSMDRARRKTHENRQLWISTMRKSHPVVGTQATILIADLRGFSDPDGFGARRR
jgi:hypothetical protein